ncbi:MAG TPA: alpha/beta fold hydrolase [Ktedonobacteraceae bacterium]|jgi:medium-chain acyl-[acyl-carrier-protein] hydrolase
MIHADVDPWLVRTPSQEPALLRLFCLPYSGGGASLFYGWQEAFPPGVEVCAIELPGRASRFGEPLASQLSPLIAQMAEALDPYFDLPFAIFGHCLGSLLGFELARYVRRQYDIHPVHLFLSAHCAPQQMQANMSNGVPVHQLPDEAFIDEIRRLNGTPASILQDGALVRLLLPVLRADFTLSETYVYREDQPLPCAFSVFGGREDETLTPQDLAAWQEQTVGALSLCLFPGGHFFLHESQGPLLDAIAQDLQQLLAGL